MCVCIFLKESGTIWLSYFNDNNYFLRDLIQSRSIKIQWKENWQKKTKLMLRIKELIKGWLRQKSRSSDLKLYALPILISSNYINLFNKIKTRKWNIKDYEFLLLKITASDYKYNTSQLLKFWKIEKHKNYLKLYHPYIIILPVYLLNISVLQVKMMYILFCSFLSLIIYLFLILY